ncbi:MAG TPA: FGGY family carbohydrate kinase [Solirubrobacteraceae bacterium]|jgi:xylulokinase
MTYVVGIDVGSQSVKAVLVDELGATVATASSPCDTSYPASGWAEQDPRRWEQAITEAVRELRSAAGIGATEVAMLALACQVDGLVALDRNLRPLRPAIIWLDRRATAQSDRLRDAVGESVLIERTGLNPDASHTAPKAMWLRDEEPENFRAARWLVSTVGHLNGWLTGEVVQDHADASSTLLYNLAARRWCSELVGLAGLDEARLPSIRAAREVIGSLRSDVAERLGLSTRCQVAVGTGDDHGAALGAGAVAPGIIVDVTGTAEPVAVASRELVLDELRLVETHAHAVDGMLLVENPGFVSGGSTNWWARAQGIPQAELFAQAALAPPGSDGALFLPTLSGSTAPRWNDRMRGCFAGLGLHHELAHMSRAILEGCSFALRDIVDRFEAMGLGGEEIRVVGGGARSPLWLQIKADVTGRPVRVVRGETTGAGAAMLAGVAAGFFADLPEAAARMVRIDDEPVLPRQQTREAYDTAYDAYRRLFDGVEHALA